MTSRGNTKQRIAFGLAVFFFVSALICATLISNQPLSKGLAFVSMLAGIVCFVGVWVSGLPQNPDPDTEQW